MLKDTCILVYTNENYQPIADLSAGEFDKFFPENPIKRYIISNSFKNYEFKNKNSVFIDAQTEFDGMGGHFGRTMRSGLTHIDEDYIIFFCDDYMLIDKPNLNYLVELMDIIRKDNIDYFSFASNRPKPDWNKCQISFNGLPNRNFYHIPENYQYRHSVQPCIWKKSSLIELLNYNTEIPLHHLDTTNIKNREGYYRHFDPLTATWGPFPNGTQGFGFKCVCTDYDGYDELFNYEYFIFPYVEIVRHGFFNMWQETNTKRFLQKFIEERKINEDIHLKKFIA